MTGIRKTYPGVVALAGVDFDLRQSEVHVILGENGAGKSTLIKVLGGGRAPDAGEIRIDGSLARITSAADPVDGGTVTVAGQRLRHGSPRAAREVGLGLVPEDRLPWRSDTRPRSSGQHAAN